MAVKILIERKITPGREYEVGELTRRLRATAIQAPGYISGETLRSVQDPSVHLVISTWKTIEDWNNWLATPQRKALQQDMDSMLEQPTAITAYQPESLTERVNETLSRLEFLVEGQ